MSIAIFVFISFLFHLRVLDDIKDFDYDSTYHNERPIQTGSVNLHLLKILMVLFIIITVGISTLFYDSAITLILVFCYLYSYMMFKEFYKPHLSQTNTILYLILHELVFIPFFLYIFSVVQGTLFIPDSLAKLLLLIYLFTTIPLIEIGRKIKLRTDSSGTLTNDTYSFKWGQKNTVRVFSLLVLLAAVCTLFIPLFSPYARIILFVSGTVLFALSEKFFSFITTKSMPITTIIVLLIPLLLII